MISDIFAKLSPVGGKGIERIPTIVKGNSKFASFDAEEELLRTSER